MLQSVYSVFPLSDFKITSTRDVHYSDDMWLSNIIWCPNILCSPCTFTASLANKQISYICTSYVYPIYVYPIYVHLICILYKYGFNNHYHLVQSSIGQSGIWQIPSWALTQAVINFTRFQRADELQEQSNTNLNSMIQIWIHVFRELFNRWWHIYGPFDFHDVNDFQLLLLDKRWGWKTLVQLYLIITVEIYLGGTKQMLMKMSNFAIFLLITNCNFHTFS